MRLFRWGFFCLPLLWLLNWALYRRVVDMVDAPAEMKMAVRWSLIGFGVACAVLLVRTPHRTPSPSLPSAQLRLHSS